MTKKVLLYSTIVLLAVLYVKWTNERDLKLMQQMDSCKWETEILEDGSKKLYCVSQNKI